MKGNLVLFVVTAALALLMPLYAQDWVSRYDGPGAGSDEAVGVVLVAGVPYVAGTSTQADNCGAFVVLKHDPGTGEIVLYRHYQRESGEDSDATAVAASEAGNIYVAGRASTSDDDHEVYFTVVKWSSGLSQLWVFGKRDDEEAGCEALATQGDTAFAAGSTYGGDTEELDYLTCKLQPNEGRASWTKTYVGPGEDDDIATAVAVDGAGSVYVTGSSPGLAGDDYATVKYSRTGDTQWAVRYDGGRDDQACAIAVGVAGNVYVTGLSGTLSNGNDYLTIKLSAAGDTVWTRRYNGPGNASDEPSAMAVDTAGNVYVTGHSVGHDSTSDWLTIKYGPGGGTIWSRRHNGPASGGDAASALFLDEANGWLYVTGYDSSEGGARDYLTIKYSTDSGCSLCAWRYDGPVHGNDMAASIVVDPDGNVYVTGTSDSASADIVTVKYGPAYASDIGIRAILQPPAVLDSGRTVVPTAVVCNNTDNNCETLTVRMRIGGFYERDTTLGLAARAIATLAFEEWQVVQVGSHAVLCTLLLGDDNLSNNRIVTTTAVAGTGWIERRSVSAGGVKDGGWLSYNPGDSMVYAGRGYKSLDFLRYDPRGDTWTTSLTDVPEGAKPCYKGTNGVVGDGFVYLVKGNNTFEFYRYDITGVLDWEQLANVPPGTSGKKVKVSDLVYVPGGDSLANYVYMLKGNKSDFMRFNTGTLAWEPLPDAPAGAKPKWDKGSFLVYDGVGTIYAHKARHNELWAFSIATQTWGATALPGMPLIGRVGKSKESKDGGNGAFHDGAIHALKGRNTQEFWKYDVAANAWTEYDTIPAVGSTGKKKRVKNGGDVASIGDDVFFVLKGNRTMEFWRYLPDASATSLAARSGSAPEAKAGGGGLDGGEEPIAEGYDAGRPRWSPDGRYVCYFRDDDFGVEQVFVSDLAGEHEWQLTFGEGDCENPVWSPDGNHVAFQQDDTASCCWQIARVPFVATGQYDASAVVPGAPAAVKRIDGPKAAGGVVRGVLAPASGDAVPQVLTADDCDHENPDWSPDGGWLVYQKDDETGYTQLYRVPAVGGNEQQLTADEADHEDPRYLTNSIIVYTRSVYGEYDQICRLHLPTLQQYALTATEYDHGRPAPQPAGIYVAFEVDDDYGMTQVGRVSVAGGYEAVLTAEEIDLETPVWSADGQSVFCVGWRYPGSEIGLVDGAQGGYEAITDALTIRLNPDVYYAVQGAVGVNLVAYERDDIGASGLDEVGGQRPRRSGRGIYLVRVARRPGGGAQAAGALGPKLERVRPNPAAGQLGLRWQVPGRDRVTVRAFDAAGRLVRTLCDQELAPGAYDCRWDCTDGEGRLLPAGVYFIRLATGGRELKQKVVLQR
jgi:hypothetical protein